MTSRALTPNERAIISALLDDDGGPGVDNYRAQMDGMQAEIGCTCGCGSLDLIAPDGAAPGGHPNGPVFSALIHDETGEPIGEVSLWSEDGIGHRLEVSTWFDNPLPMPTPDQLVKGPAYPLPVTSQGATDLKPLLASCASGTGRSA